MTFNINFTDAYGIDGVDPSIEKIAEITIGDFHELIVVPIFYWSESDYKKQWHQALSDITKSSNFSCALIVAMHDLKTADYITSWPLYREGDIVYIQNKLLLAEQIGRDFDINKIKTYIGKRETVDEENNAISEWQAGIEDIRDAVSRLA